MSPVADNPVIAPDRELDDEKKARRVGTAAHPLPASAWSPRKKTNGSAPAVMNGTHSTREGCARLVSSVGLKLSAYRAVDGRRTWIGMLPEPKFKEAISEVR
jgi:hypothetical protein